MEILDEKDGVDTELLVYAMTLLNKVPPAVQYAVHVPCTLLGLQLTITFIADSPNNTFLINQ